MRIEKYPILNKWLREAHLPHGLLFVGASLSEQLALATTLSQQLLCETQSACQTCQACRWVKEKHHPDTLYFPAEDQASIKVDDVRSMTHFLYQSAHQGKMKIVVLAPAEAMPAFSQNALLKILEEPPSNSLILLLSQHPNLLLPTVRSRCQRLILSSRESIDEALVADLGKTLDQIRYKKASPFDASQRWQKTGLAKVLEGLYFYILRHPAVERFVWLDEVNKVRGQLMRKLNPNPVIVLENLFYQWGNLYDVD